MLVRRSRRPDFWRAVAGGFLLGCALIGAVVVGRWSSHDHKATRSSTPRLVKLTPHLPPMRAHGCTDTWVATRGGTDWTFPGNWSARRVPSQDDRACIPDGALVLLNGARATVASVAVEGTLSMDNAAMLDLDNASQRSSFEVLVLQNARLEGRSPVIVTGTFSWLRGGVVEGPAPITLARRSVTGFDAGDGGRGVLLRRLMLARGRFELISGALYVTGKITNFGHMVVNNISPRGYPAGLLNAKGRPVAITGKLRKQVPPGVQPGTPGSRRGRPPPRRGVPG
jgi:hypothetical protein